MSNREELNTRIQYLQSISPILAENAFQELKEAFDTYFYRDEEFILQVNKTLDKVISNIFHHKIKYERQELLDRWQNTQFNPPAGFNDVREIFIINEIVEEITNIADDVFLAAFYLKDIEIEGSSGNEGSTRQELHNTLMDKWIAELTEEKPKELAGLKTIMQSCANRGYAPEFALLFEELGNCTNRKSIKSFAKDIFYNRGYGWLIETFNLDSVYRPSYINELSYLPEET